MGTAEPSSDPVEAELDLLVERTRGLQPWRRILHAFTGVVLGLGPGGVGLTWTQTVVLLAAGFLVLGAFDLARLRWPQLNVLFFRLLPSFVSPREAARPASSTWYALGALAVWVATPEHAVPALLVLGLADPCASAVGRLKGRRRLGKGSVEGSVAFFAVASFVLLMTVGHPGVLAVAVGVTLVEVLPLRLDDNLTVPLSAALFLHVGGF